MVNARRGFNPKRSIASIDALSQDECAYLVRHCRYAGSPLHKRDPGDYDLMPPSSPRPGKTLCDAAGRISKDEAQKLLRDGFTKKMVSVRRSNQWPELV